MSRLPELPVEKMNERQRAIYGRSGSASRGGVGRGPSHTMILSPDFAELAMPLGEFVLKKNSLGQRLTELAILVTAHHWSSAFEWRVHAAAAVKHGIDQKIVDAIQADREPEFTQEDERIVYAFSVEMYRDHKISSATFDRAATQFGLGGITELAGVLGYYSMGAMLLSAFELEPPAQA